MANRQPANLSDIYAAQANIEKRRVGAAYAAAYGPPPNSVELTDAQRLRLAQIRYPRPFDGSIPPDHPSAARVQELLQAGHVDEAMAIFSHPFLEVAYTRGIEGIEDRVEMGKKLARAMLRAEEKALTSMMDGEPEPEEPGEVAPSAPTEGGY